MTRSNPLKRTTLGSLATLMCVVGSSAFAHTGVRDQAEAGKTSYNAFTITHGCGGHDDSIPPLMVRGQSAVLPFGAAVWTDATGAVIPTGAVGIVSEDDDFITLNAGSIDDDDPFHTNEEETDDLENVRALNWKGGPELKTNLVGLPQFRVSAPTILDDCVSVLRVRIAVANWCKIGRNEANDRNNNRADWWFPGPALTGSTLFVDPDLVQETFWTTLTVNNPNAALCTGTPREVNVQPTGADIDTYLPYKPFTKGVGPF